jgi:hypothetical protein
MLLWSTMIVNTFPVAAERATFARSRNRPPLAITDDVHHDILIVAPLKLSHKSIMQRGR